MLKFLAVLVIIIASFSYASPDKGNEYTSKAWKSFTNNDYKSAEDSFLQAIKEDDKNSRAYLGLSMLYSFIQKNNKSWDTFRRFTELEKESTPYIYSQMLTSTFASGNMLNEKINYLEKAASSKLDDIGVLNAMCYERLQGMYQGIAQLGKSDSAADKMNAIKDWLLLGPFENISASGYDKQYPPENEFHPEKEYEGKNYIPVKWLSPAAIARTRWIDFMTIYGEYNAVYYANTFVYSPKKQSVLIRIGTSGSLKTFLNDAEIMNISDELNNDLDTYIVETELQEGWNKLLIKCGLSEITKCNFLVRITTASGTPVEGLKYSASEQKYQKTSAPSRIISNSFIDFFKNKIKGNPGEPENYILLADSYLRNDMGIEAELVLKDGIRNFPGSSLFYYRLWEAYTRGKKSDDAETILTKLYKTDPLIPPVLDRYTQDLVKKNNLSQVEELVSQFEKTDPDTEMLLLMKLALAAAKKDNAKVSSIVEQLYVLNPTLNSVYLKGALEYQKTQDVNRLINVLEENLSKIYTEETLTLLAQVYLQAGKKELWERTIEKLSELSPQNSEIHFAKAEVHIKMEDYSKAETEIKKALEIAPRISSYIERLGDVYKLMGKTKEAGECFSQAVFFDPKNYNSRDKLRDIQGKKPIEKVFETTDVDELMKKSPAASDYPGMNAVYLLNDTKKIIYGKGAAESIREELIKILDKKGIDKFKEYPLTEYSSVKTIIEESYTIKKDGTRIKADVNNGKLYFKSLEENDFLYIKTRTREYYEGMLSNQYWDNHLFNGFYPYVKTSYSILFPDNIKLNYNTRRFDMKPKVTTCEEGTIYSWNLENEPALQEEPSMPQLYDIGKIVSVSTIPDWKYLVDWYSDLSRNKTKSSFEVKEKVQELLMGMESLRPEKKIEIIYNFITENIRYSYVPFRQSNFIPQSARDVLVNKIGDCKDVSTLFIAMLNEAGIKADYVLVNTRNAGKNEGILPSIEFNHCIASVQLNNKTRYYDLTAENFDPFTLPWGDTDAFALQISSDSKAPVYLKQEENPEKIARLHYASFKDEGVISDSIVSFKTSSQAAYTRETYRYSAEDERLKNAQASLNVDYPGAKINYLNFYNIDEITPELKYTFVIDYPSIVTDAGAFRLFKIPWFDILSNELTASTETRIYPLSLVGIPDTIYEKIDLTLPEGYALLEGSYEKSLNCSSLSYNLKYTAEGNVLTAERFFVRKGTEVKPEDYKEYREFYRKAMKEDAKQILLQKKG